jgi:hypothetical protein
MVMPGTPDVHPVNINKGCRLTCSEPHTKRRQEVTLSVCGLAWLQFNTVTVSYFRCHSAHVGERIVMNLGPEDRLAKLHADSIKSDSGRTCCFSLKTYLLNAPSQIANKKMILLASSCLPVPRGTTRLPHDRFSLNLTFEYISGKKKTSLVV